MDYEEGIQQISQHPAVVVSNDEEDEEQHSRQYTMAKNVAQSIRLPKQEDGCPPSPTSSSRTPIASNVSNKNLNNHNNNNSGEKRRESMLRIPKDGSSESTANSTFVPTSQQQNQQSLPWWLFPSAPTKQFSFRTKKRLKYAFIFGWILVLILITTAIILAVTIKPSPGPTVDASNLNKNPTSQPTLSQNNTPETPSPTLPRSPVTTPPITPRPQTLSPTKRPTPNPTRLPTSSPTTKSPTESPTNSPTKTPTAAPTIRNTSQREQDILEKLFEISGRLTILDPTSPQNQAMRWIIDTDPIQTNPNDDQFLSRYSAATFYFATSSSSPWSNCGSDPTTSPCVNIVTSRIFDRPRSNNSTPSRFLSSSHVCNWFGISCNDKDQITVINLRK